MRPTIKFAVPSALSMLLWSGPSEAAKARRGGALPRLDEAVIVDGSLADAAWEKALRIEHFYEISPGDSSVPVVRTTAYAGYDSQYFYAAVRSFDPMPADIRASFSDRDSVLSDQDFVQLDLDTRNDEKSSLIFRVNPRGVLADGVFSEATGLDDFSPDFSFEAEARIVADGWVAEFRIPLSTLRYPRSSVQTWGITFYRNYPRQFRRQMVSLPIPRGANCWLCYALKLTQIEDLPPSRYRLIVPFATAQNDVASAPSASSTALNGGVDLKWIPRADLTLDATLNPDFAQVEADAPQISVNTRFALFYPEKRGFFQEGADLLLSPLQAVYTRSIASPAWGARATGAFGNGSYTLLAAEDEGGGTKVVPGPISSELVPQKGPSLALVGRLRYTLGQSFAGLVFTGREGDGSNNRVLGPDVLWRPTETSQVAAQWLFSSTRFNSYENATDSALSVNWQYSAPSRFLLATYQRLGPDFRADNGFIPQVGIDRKALSLGHRFYPEGWVRFVEAGLNWDWSKEIGDRTVSRSLYPSLSINGKWNSALTLEHHFHEQARTQTRLIDYSYSAAHLKTQPSRFLSGLDVKVNAGQQVDLVNERRGRGATLGLVATLRPGIHLSAELSMERQWLNVEGRRLFAADVAQVKLTYNFSPRAFVRTIGQYERIRRDPNLYSQAVDASEGAVSGTVLCGYRLKWQSVLYAGYSNDRSLRDGSRYESDGSHLFLKIAYAWEP